MIETRNLTREEFEKLIKESEPSETAFIAESGYDPFELFSRYEEINGLIVDGNPLYIAMIKKSQYSDKLIFWTIVNSNIKNKITLCKYCKRELKKWNLKFKEIYATIGKSNTENIKWVEWLGFKVVSNDADTITYKLGE